MVRQRIDVEGYWEVIVWYDLDYDLFNYVEDDLRKAGISRRNLETLYKEMRSGKAKAVTYNNVQKYISIVLYNKHSSIWDYMDSIVHEGEHIKQGMLYAYKVMDYGEPPAYTIGYVVGVMLRFFLTSVVNTKTLCA